MWLRTTDAPFGKITSSKGNRQKKEKRKPSMKARGLLHYLQRCFYHLHDRTEQNKDPVKVITDHVIDCPTTNKVKCSLKPVSYAMNWPLNRKS